VADAPGCGSASVDHGLPSPGMRPRKKAAGSPSKRGTAGRSVGRGARASRTSAPFARRAGVASPLGARASSSGLAPPPVNPDVGCGWATETPRSLLSSAFDAEVEQTARASVLARADHPLEPGLANAIQSRLVAAGARERRQGRTGLAGTDGDLRPGVFDQLPRLPRTRGIGCRDPQASTEERLRRLIS